MRSSTKKSLAVAAVATVVGFGALVGLNVASADEAGSTLVDRIAERFSLNRDEVQAVVNEFHGERQAEMQQKLEERLQQAVEEGKLTEEQKTLILQKHEEIKAFHESLNGKSPEERRDALKQLHEQLKQWADDNGIEFPFFMVGHGHKPFGPMHGQR